MLLGWELPNERRDLTRDEWAKVDALGSRVAKVRPYHLTPATIEGIRQRRLVVILRPDADGDIDVPARVRELSAAAWTLRENGIGNIYLLPDSEPNLGGRLPPPGYWNRVSEVITGLWFGLYDTRPLAGTVLYGSPPLAVGQGERAWYQAAGDVLAAFDVACIHTYGQLDTGLLGNTLALIKEYAPSLPILADEVGDSHPTAGWDSKGEAVRVYLDTLKAHGCAIAVLFILGGTDEWAQFVPPLDIVQQLGARFAQEVTMPTIEQRGTPTVAPGGMVEMPIRITGINDTPLDLVTLDVAYPVIPGTDDSRYGGNALGRLDVVNDGDYVARVQLAPLDVPLPGPVFGELRGNLVSHTGATITNTPFGPFYFAIQPAATPAPAPPSAHDPNAPYLHVAYHGLHEAELAAQEAGDTLLLHEIQQAIGVIDRRKTGDFR